MTSNEEVFEVFQFVGCSCSPILLTIHKSEDLHIPALSLSIKIPSASEQDATVLIHARWLLSCRLCI